jgi:hypothetical protein
MPSNGVFHRYPVDCWRFYPDSGIALARWGQRNNYPITLLESYISCQRSDTWNDFVAVFCKGAKAPSMYTERITNQFTDFTNGLQEGREGFLNFSETTEDLARRLLSARIASGQQYVRWHEIK